MSEFESSTLYYVELIIVVLSDPVLVGFPGGRVFLPQLLACTGMQVDKWATIYASI